MTKLKDLVEKYGNREIDEDELEKILKPAKKTIYDLAKGDEYFYIGSLGSIHMRMWDNSKTDSCRLVLGNIFLTKEGCEFALEKLKVTAELKRFASMCEEPIDWNNEYQPKWFINYWDNTVDVDYKYVMKENNIYFTDKSILEKTIKDIGEERIKKYYLGVKGEDK